MISGYRDSGIKSETRENSGGLQYQYGYPCTGIDRAVGVVHTQKKLALAKMEDEEGEQDLAHEQLRRVILVLGMVPVDDVAAGRGGSVYRHSPRAHQLAFSPSLCCPASRALERLEPLPTPTNHFPEV